MASAVEEVDQVIATAMSKIEAAISKLAQAIEFCEEGVGNFAEALQGCTDDEVLVVLEAQQATSGQLATARGLLLSITTKLTEYRRRLGVYPAARPSTSGPAAAFSDSTPSDSASSTQTRSELPRPPRAGKTHGRWIASNGDVVMLESGKGGEYYQAARRRAVELGLTYGRPMAEAAISRHVEVQFAMRMHDQGIAEAEIEINRRVCGTTPGRDDDLPVTCDKQLERFLPPGATLRVKDGSSPSGRLYRGKEGDR